MVARAQEAVKLLEQVDAAPGAAAKALLLLADGLRSTGATPERVRQAAKKAQQALLADGLEEEAARAGALLEALPPA